MKYRMHQKQGAKNWTLTVIDPITREFSDMGTFKDLDAARAGCRNVQRGEPAIAPKAKRRAAPKPKPKPKAKAKAKSKSTSAKER